MSACPVLWLRSDMYCVNHSNYGQNQTWSPLTGKEAGKCSPLWTQEGEDNQILMGSGETYFQVFDKDFIN